MLGRRVAPFAVAGDAGFAARSGVKDFYTFFFVQAGRVQWNRCLENAHVVAVEKMNDEKDTSLKNIQSETEVQELCSCKFIVKSILI